MLNGLLTAGKDGELIVFQTDGKQVSIARSDIDEIQTSRISLMPEGSLEPLTLKEIRSLFAYLISGKPPDDH